MGLVVLVALMTAPRSRRGSLVTTPETARGTGRRDSATASDPEEV